MDKVGKTTGSLKTEVVLETLEEFVVQDGVVVGCDDFDDENTKRWHNNKYDERSSSFISCFLSVHYHIQRRSSNSGVSTVVTSAMMTIDE